METKQVYGVLCHCIGGGLPALTLYDSLDQAAAEYQRLDDSEDWTAEISRFDVEEGLFDRFPVEMRPAGVFPPSAIDRLKLQSLLINGEQWFAFRS